MLGYLAAQGFKRGDRIAPLLPNEEQYIELIYACTGRLTMSALVIGGHSGVSRLSLPLADSAAIHALTGRCPDARARDIR